MGKGTPLLSSGSLLGGTALLVRLRGSNQLPLLLANTRESSVWAAASQYTGANREMPRATSLWCSCSIQVAVYSFVCLWTDRCLLLSVWETMHDAYLRWYAIRRAGLKALLTDPPTRYTTSPGKRRTKIYYVVLVRFRIDLLCGSCRCKVDQANEAKWVVSEE